jgi:acyl carrier protein
MSSTEIETRLKTVFRKTYELEISEEELKIEEEFFNYGVNSLDFIKFLLAIEKEFGFRFKDDELKLNAFKNLKSVIDYLEEKGC